MSRGAWRSDARVVLLPRTPRVRLLEPLVWADADGREHSVPQGFESDGATIPRWAGWCVGAPLEGPYRRAAILHDWQCIVEREPHLVVHRRFHEAMLADFVPPPLAWLFFAVVRVLGPRWPSAPGVRV